jgi:hypothetical protein
LRDRNLDQVADDLLNVAPDIADLGEFGGFDLDERRAGEFRQPPRDLGLADAGRPGLRSAIATARLAASWPTMCLSSSCTISCGVISCGCTGCDGIA